MSLRVQSTGAVTGGNTGNSALNGVQTGDRLIVCVREENDVSMTVTSSLDGALTNVIESAAAAAQVQIWTFVNATAGDHTITVATTGSNTTYDWNASAHGEMVTSGGADATNSANGSGAVTHGSVTPSAIATIITCAGFGGDNGGETPGSDGMTALDINGSAGSGRQYFQYKTGHTGAIDGDFTTTNGNAYDAVIAAFLEATAAPETITVDKWLNTMPAAHKRVHGVVTSGFLPPNRFGS